MSPILTCTFSALKLPIIPIILVNYGVYRVPSGTFPVAVCRNRVAMKIRVGRGFQHQVGRKAQGSGYRKCTKSVCLLCLTAECGGVEHLWLD